MSPLAARRAPPRPIEARAADARARRPLEARPPRTVAAPEPAPVEAEPLRLAIDVVDPGLADRIAALLAPVKGLRLVPSHEAADAVVSAPGGKPPGLALTPREEEVLAILAEGASNREIAERLGISPHTAKFHVRSLYEKLDATGRVDAVAHAARIGAIQL